LLDAHRVEHELLALFAFVDQLGSLFPAVRRRAVSEEEHPRTVIFHAIGAIAVFALT